MALVLDPGTIQNQPQQNDPTQGLESQVTPSANVLGQALQNLQNQQPQPQVQQPQQPDPSQQPQGPAQQDPTQNAPGGPVKHGLMGVLLRIIGNVAAGGLPAAAYPGSIMGEAHQRNQVAVQESQARTGTYNAQTNEANAQAADLQSQATLRNAQAKPRLLIDPQTGGPAFDPQGNPRIGSLADQNEMNDMFKVTGGYISVPAGLAASIGMPELTGHPVPANTFNTILTNQNSKTVESEIARLTQFELSKGRDPLQSPDVQSLIQIRKQMQNYTPGQLEQNYLDLYSKKRSGEPLTPQQEGFLQGFDHLKTLEATTRFNLQMGANSPNLPSTPTIDDVPAYLKPQVQGILDYRVPMPPMGRNNPQNQLMQRYVMAIDPTYDATTFPARNSIVKSYTSGPESKSINAINTALGHLGELGQAAQLLNQRDLPALHALAAKLGAASGDDAATTYTNILHRVSPELTTAYLASGGGEAERGANESDFDISKGAQQITSNIAESAKLLRSKINAQEQQWNTTFRPTRPQDQFETRFITPQAKATLDQFSAEAPTSKAAAANALTVTDPRGGLHTFRDQASADAFKKAAGIQ